ncbi:MAG: amidohydrolase family protein [Acetobacteraceae bacterium]|nr:amidohydrolase family protein [Acetobacteraceae bacterium]
MPDIRFDRLILGDIVTPERVLEGGWIGTTGETIAGIGQGSAPKGAETLDYSGHLVLPGLVDGHMHTSSAMGWGGIVHATRSAAAGGVTTVVDMPYDIPHPVTDAAILAEKLAVVEADSHVDVALYGTILKSGGTGAIAGLAQAGVSAFKLSTYEYDAVRFPRISPQEMTLAFGLIGETGIPVALHNENQELVESLTEEAKAAGRTDPIQHARTRPPLAENLANTEIFEIGLATGAHVHIAHSSLARGFDLAAAYRGFGMKASAEACIQYLCMTEDDLVRLAGRGKCNPPFRTAEEVERMWDRLTKGLVEYVSTDHAPWPLRHKQDANIFRTGAGLTGLQSFAPLMLTLLARRGLPPTLIAQYCAERTARFHGLYPRKGAIRVGSDADFCIIERGRFVFDEASIVDRPECRWSPYHGMEMAGRVAASVLRGTLIYSAGTVHARPGTGRFVRRAGS